MSFTICSDTNLLQLQKNYQEIYTFYQSQYQLLLSKLTLLASHPETITASNITDIESVITNAYWKNNKLFRFDSVSSECNQNYTTLSPMGNDISTSNYIILTTVNTRNLIICLNGISKVQHGKKVYTLFFL